MLRLTVELPEGSMSRNYEQREYTDEQLGAIINEMAEVIYEGANNAQLL